MINIIYMSSTSVSDDSNNNPNKDKLDSKKNEISTDEGKGSSLPTIASYYNDFFDIFRQNMRNMMEGTWPNSIFPTIRTFSPFEIFDKMTDIRLPLCDVNDKGDRYDVTLEIPGIDKDKINVKATKNSVTISGKQSDQTKEKGKNYVYSERSYKSFHRRTALSSRNSAIKNYCQGQ